MIRELSALVLGFGLSLAVFILARLLATTYKKPQPVLDLSIWPLLLAPIFFVISRYLPNFYEVFNNATFVQHAVGGGFVSALVFIYLKNTFQLKFPFWLDITCLYGVVSILGVTNELLEFFVTQTGIYQVDGSDVWWDLTANTVGAFLFYGAYSIAAKLLRKK